MSPVKHPVSGAVLSFSLEQELRTVREQLGTAAARVGRTLVKQGPLRATLVGLNAGGTMESHKSDGPITVQVLEGEIEFEVAGTAWTLPAGTLFTLAGGVVHAVSAPRGGIFLLTMAAAVPEAASDAAAGRGA